MTDPYTPPRSPVKLPPDSERRSSLGAIALGFLADVGGTMVFSVVVTFLASVALGAASASPEELSLLIQHSPGFQLLNLAGGLSFTALGGYVAARFANHSEYANAFAVGLASFVFGEAVLLAFPQDLPIWVRIFGDALVVPAALVGGHFRMQQKRTAP
jgi:hypothetical protein